MPRPPSDGCYRYANRAGEVAVVQWSGGSPVEWMQFRGRLDAPPRRLSIRYLGESVAAVLEETRRREEERRMRAWMELTGGYL